MRDRYDREGKGTHWICSWEIDRYIMRKSTGRYIIVNHDEKGRIVEIEIRNARKLLGGDV